MRHVPDFLDKLPKLPNLTESAYLSLKQHMLDGSLVEGARLTEESLATKLGISKSPVREALNRLETEGLVRIESRRGAYVRKFTTLESRGLLRPCCTIWPRASSGQEIIWKPVKRLRMLRKTSAFTA